MAVDHQVKRMMEELSRALGRAIQTSSDVSEAIRKIRLRGFSPQLLLSWEQGAGVPPAAHQGAEGGLGADIEIAAYQDLPGKPAGSPVAGKAAFRLNGRDVALLKSMGIDPTRRGRSPRRLRKRGRYQSSARRQDS